MPGDGVAVSLMPALVVPLEWHKVEAHVIEALKLDNGCFLPQDIRDLAAAGVLHLWVPWRNGEALAVAITTVTRYPRRAVLSVLYLEGRELQLWIRPLLALAIEWSKGQGCTAMAATLRRGWARVADMDEAGAYLWREYGDAPQ